MEQLYTNWNAGLTKDGKSKTFDYKFDRKQTVAYADVERMIDESLRKGSFEEIDDLYVKILNGTCGHVGHSGPNGYPSKKDRCAIYRRVVDKKKQRKNYNSGLTKKAVKRKNQGQCTKLCGNAKGVNLSP